MLPLFKLSSTEPIFEFEEGKVALISAFACSPSNDVFLVALTTMQVLRFQIALGTKVPVTNADCDFCIGMGIIMKDPYRQWMSVVTMDWSDMGVILGDSYDGFYIVRDDSILVMHADGLEVWRYDAVLPTLYHDAGLPAACSGPISEVFFWKSR